MMLLDAKTVRQSKWVRQQLKVRHPELPTPRVEDVYSVISTGWCKKLEPPVPGLIAWFSGSWMDAEYNAMGILVSFNGLVVMEPVGQLVPATIEMSDGNAAIGHVYVPPFDYTTKDGTRRVYEGLSAFYIESLPDGEEVCIGDGVDMVWDENCEPIDVGTPEFYAALRENVEQGDWGDE